MPDDAPAAPLPDDLARWPRHPAEILGVSPGADPREIRRAYTRLLRLYKPEREPEKFQRVRAAYEALTEAAEFHATFGGPSDGPTDGEAQHTAPQRYAVRTPEAEAAWELACDRQVGTAFATLRMLAGRDAEEDVFLRLYWLARLYPDVSGDPAVVWLSRGIAQHGLTDRLGGTYFAEVLIDPVEALSDRCGAAAAESGSLPLRFALLHARWEAAARLTLRERHPDGPPWKLIASDLKRLRPRLTDAPPDAWPRLLFAANDYLAWMPGEEATKFTGWVRSQIEACGDVGGGLEHDFERFELLTEMQTAFPRQGPAAEGSWLALIAGAWISDAARIREMLQRRAVGWISDPVAALEELDALAAAAPAAALFLAQIASGLNPSGGLGEDAGEETRGVRIGEELATRLADAVAAGGGLPEFRAEAARCCFDEAIGFGELVAVLDPETPTPPLPPDLAAAIVNDLALRCLIDAGRTLYVPM